MIKFVRFISDIATKLDALRVNALARRVPTTEAIPMPTETAVAEAWRVGRPAWSSLVLEVESGRVLREEEKSYLEALDWYLRCPPPAQRRQAQGDRYYIRRSW